MELENEQEKETEEGEVGLSEEEKKRMLMHLYATASEASYIRPRKDREAHMIKNNLGDWKLDRDLSSHEISVWTNADTSDVIYTIRGTDSRADILTDGFLSLGLERLTPRYKSADKGLQATAKKYGGMENIILTGHSLGGMLASDLAKKYGNEAHIFNPGSSPYTARKGAVERLAKGNKKFSEQKKRINSYIIAGDVISNSSAFDPSVTTHFIDDNPKVKRRGPLYYHSLDHFKMID